MRTFCEAKVYVRDQYRYTGDTSSGCRLSYEPKRCAHYATEDGLCGAHYRMQQAGATVDRVPDWHTERRERRRA